MHGALKLVLGQQNCMSAPHPQAVLVGCMPWSIAVEVLLVQACCFLHMQGPLAWGPSLCARTWWCSRRASGRGSTACRSAHRWEVAGHTWS